VERVNGTKWIAAFALLLAFGGSSFATTCVWGKKFKTRKVCGIVRDMSGAELPGATIQIEKADTQAVVAESPSHTDGSFAVANVADGDYVIRVKSNGFWDATQNFRLDRPLKGTRCSHPIRVVMKPAGSCSYVENAWKK
jgi:hypothetical protein